MGNEKADLPTKMQLKFRRDAYERKHGKTEEDRLDELKKEGFSKSAARKKWLKEAEQAAEEARREHAEPSPFYRELIAMQKGPRVRGDD